MRCRHDADFVMAGLGGLALLRRSGEGGDWAGAEEDEDDDYVPEADVQHVGVPSNRHPGSALRQ